VVVIGLVPLLALLAATPGAAQVVSGRVVDPEGSAIPAVNVSLRSTDGSHRVAAVTDPGGRFRIDLPAPGSYLLRAQRLGYEALETEPFQLSREPLELMVTLDPEAIALDPVTVIGTPQDREQQWLERSGFNHRRALGLGTFISREELERRGAFSLIDTFYGVRGFRVIRLDHRDRHVIAGRSSAPCYPAVFVDGVHLQRIGEDVLNHINLRDVAGIEAYPNQASIPVRYNERGRACAAILVWTR
jgi:hypothetical protein